MTHAFAGALMQRYLKMKRFNNFAQVGVIAGMLLLAQSVRAEIVMSYQAAGVETTPIATATTETFDNVPVAPVSQVVNEPWGSYTVTPNNASGEGALLPYVSPIGTFSGQGIIIPADQWAGAGGTGNYLAAGEEWNPNGLGDESMTLTLNTPANYLGFFAEAMDTSNIVSFYDGSTLVGVFHPDILGNNDYNGPYNAATGTFGDNLLSAAYYGNPDDPGSDTGEPFVYLNFTTTGSTEITSVVFNCDLTYNGFEVDNLSVASGNFTPPGTVVGDGGATALLLAVALGLLVTVGASPSRFWRSAR
jgi:hypothetical protein